MQREDVLEHALHILEHEGISATTLEMIAQATPYSIETLQQFWPDNEAILYDALRYLCSRVDVWQRQLMADESISTQQKLLQRYDALTDCVNNDRYPGCLFIAACTFYPDATHPIHQLADLQKQASWEWTHALLTSLNVDDPAMVANQMELVLEGCLSKLLIKHNQADIDTAKRLAEDILQLSLCRKGGALT